MLCIVLVNLDRWKMRNWLQFYRIKTSYGTHQNIFPPLYKIALVYDLASAGYCVFSSIISCNRALKKILEFKAVWWYHPNFIMNSLFILNTFTELWQKYVYYASTLCKKYEDIKFFLHRLIYFTSDLFEHIHLSYPTCN